MAENEKFELIEITNQEILTELQKKILQSFELTAKALENSLVTIS